MAILYVESWGEAGGKTALCAGIANYWQNKGKRVGYLKPIVIDGRDGDAQFIKQALGLEEPVEALHLLRLTRPELWTEVKKGSLGAKVKEACSRVAGGKDIVLLEGFGALSTDTVLAEASSQIIEALNARLVITLSYSDDLPWDRIASFSKKLPRLLGVVVNRVPRRKVESVRTEMTPFFAKEDIKVLGVLPEEPLLLGISLAELAEKLEATVLCCPEALGELVEKVMLGALSVDSGLDYFSRKANKVVITRSERPDIQLAALATSTKGIILSGDTSPIPQVLHWAEDKGVPILITKQDTFSIVAKVEEAFLQARFHHQKKLNKLTEILDQHFDFERLSEQLAKRE